MGAVALASSATSEELAANSLKLVRPKNSRAHIVEPVFLGKHLSDCGVGQVTYLFWQGTRCQKILDSTLTARFEPPAHFPAAAVARNELSSLVSVILTNENLIPSGLLFCSGSAQERAGVSPFPPSPPPPSHAPPEAQD